MIRSFILKKKTHTIELSIHFSLYFISNRINKLFNNFSCVVITGARQVGKSTLLQKLYPDIPCITFDPIYDIQNARADPKLFLDNNPPPIILDEIQYAPEIVPVIKRRLDKIKKTVNTF